jgi:ubiquitin C-terminal hydrolase
MSFQNLGNTCYVSSVLQCLFSTHFIQKYILQSNDTFNEFSEFKLAMTPYLNNYVINSSNILQKLNPVFLKQEQQDVVEFLLDIIDCLRKNVDSLNCTTYKGPCKSNWCDDGKYNIIDEIFKFQKEILFECQHCQHCFNTFESDYIIHGKFEEEEETLSDYKCDKCSFSGSVIRSVKYTHYPQVFIICNPSKLFLRWKCYRTFSLCIHKTLNGNIGHYTSLIRNEHGWVHCDDDIKNKIKDINQHEIGKIRLMFLCKYN